MTPFNCYPSRIVIAVSVLIGLFRTAEPAVGATGPATITNQPSNQVVLEGTPATFMVGADGTAPITYQWYRNSQVLPNANSDTYTTPNTTVADDNAGFTVVVSNASGSQTSRVAVLRVDPGVLVSYGTNAIPLSTHSWRYNQPTASLGTTWRDVAYNDSAWQSGYGLFGYETSTTYPDIFRTALPASGSTVYFRTHFTLDGDPSMVSLVASNLIDDGVVYYLNGVYVGSLRVPTAPNQSFSDLGENPATEGAWDVINLPTASLVRGDNVLAAELHQSSTTSSDIVFGMSLFAMVTNRVADTNPPLPVLISPPPGSTVLRLGQLEVHFNEPVDGVDAADLLINGTATTTNLVFLGPEAYIFRFPQPLTGMVEVAWSPSHGIRDQAVYQNAFAGGTYTYNLDPNYVTSEIRINEFMAANNSGIRDEEGRTSDWIELYNSGSSTISLANWYLSNDPNQLQMWRFPAIAMQPNSYLRIWASGNDRTDPGAPLHTNFRLDRDQGYLYLVGPGGTNILSGFFPSYPVQYDDISYGRDQLDPAIVGYFAAPTPDGANGTIGLGVGPEVQFSRNSGTFTTAFSLTLSTPAPNTEIRYFLVNNASSAQQANIPISSMTVYSGPIQVNSTVQIRARVVPTLPGYLPGPLKTETYIQLSANAANFTSASPIVLLNNFGGGGPAGEYTSSGAIGVMMVFDTNTVSGRAALTNTPSVVSRVATHARGSSTLNYPKRSLALEAFGEVNFDDRNIDMLGMPADSDWVFYAPNYFDAVLIKNPFAHAVSRELLGRYSPRTRLVETFLDLNGGPVDFNPSSTGTGMGDYYGVHVVLEKIKVGNDRVDIARLTKDETDPTKITGGYIMKIDRGGDPDDGNDFGSPTGYNLQNTIKFVDPDGLQIGLPAQRNAVISYFTGFENALRSANYQDPVTGYAAWIDPDQWIDNHILNVLPFNIDGYRLSGFFYKDRIGGSSNGRIQQGPLWDFDRTQGCGGPPNNDNRAFNPRLWRVQATGDQGTDLFGNPSLLGVAWWQRLFSDIDFWQRWVDRWQDWRRTTLTASRLHALTDALGDSVREAQVREVARWGGNGNSNTRPRSGNISANGYSYSFPGTYQGELDFHKTWMSDRLAFIDGQLLAPPVTSRQGGLVSPGTTVTISGPAGATLYYTLNGTDPRSPGGAVSPTALSSSSPLTLTITSNVRLFVRCRNLSHSNLTGGNPGGNPPLSTPWSGRTIESFYVAVPELRITEIMFEPRPAPAGNTNDANNFEFVELKNVGVSPINLAGFSFTNGIYFTFSNNLPVLQSGQYVLVVKNLAAFQSRYPGVGNIAGEYTGNLANEGETLYLEGPLKEPVLNLTYDNAWYRLTRGNGFSLVVTDENAPAGTWTNAASWRASSLEDGSPGAPDPMPLSILPVYVNEVIAHPVPPAPDAIELFNPNASEVNIGGWYLSDDFGTPKKFRIPDGTTLQPGEFRVYTEADFNANPVLPTSFALGARGDDVFLFSADASGRLTGYYHGFDFGDSPLGTTFGRHVTSIGEDKLVLQTTNTLGAANSGPIVGPIAITEIMYRPPDYLVGTNWIDNADDEFVELYNLSDQAAPLYDPAHPTNTWQLRDAVQFTFPTNVSIPPNGYVLVVNFDPQTNAAMLASFRSLYGVAESLPIFGPYGGKLSNTRDSVELVRPDVPVVLPGSGVVVVPEILVDRVQYTNSTPWPCGSDGTGNSLQRLQPGQYGNDPGNWLSDVPTPGAATIVKPAGLATIVQQPQSKVVPVGANVTFTVSQCGLPPFTYAWTFNGEEIPNANLASLTLNGVQLADSGDYVVHIGNGAGVVVSQPARLVVQLPPTIQVHPQSQTVLGYTMASLTVVPAGTPPFSYQWKLNGANVAGGTNQTLVITSATEASRGNYTVQVYNTAGSALSSAATLTVNLPAKIVQQPFDIDTTNGYSVSFLVLASGDGVLGYQWYLNGQPLPGATAAQLNLNNVGSANEGIYNLVVSNQFGVDVSRDARLTILVMPSFVEHPESYVVAVGSDVALRVVVDGSRPMGYRWRRNSITIVPFEEGTDTLWLRDVQLEDWGTYMVIATNAARLTGVGSRSAYVTVVDPPVDRMVLQGSNVTLRSQVSGTGTSLYSWRFNGSPIAGATSSDLTLTNVSPDDAGTYTLTVSNVVAKLAGGFSMVLTVQESATPPEITLQPTNRVVITNGTARFYAAASGTDPLSYQWWFNATNLLDGATNASLTLTNLQTTNSGNYQLVAQNLAGAATSQVAVLSVAEPPRITTQPRSYNLSPGDDVSLSVVVSGTPPFTYQWYYNQTNPIPGATTVSLFFETASPLLAGTYHVTVSNAVGGAVSDPATLVVLAPPAIVQHPASVVAVEGTNVVFNAVAAGSGPFSYQWWFNFAVLPGATSPRLAINNVQQAHVGAYFLVVNNTYGAVTSAVATLSFGGADRDNDGIPDDWEIAHGLNPDNPGDGSLDNDGDGLSNQQEFIAGTDPNRKDSTLKLEPLAPSDPAGTGAVLQFNAVSNKSYSVLYGNQVNTTTWLPYLQIPPAPTNRQIGVTNVSTNQVLFFRIATPQVLGP